MTVREEPGRQRRIDLITRSALLLAWGVVLICPPILFTWLLWAPGAGEYYVSANRTYISLGATSWYGYTYTAASGKGSEWYNTTGLVLAIVGSVLVWVGAVTAHLLTRRWIVSVLIRPERPANAPAPPPQAGIGVGADPLAVTFAPMATYPAPSPDVVQFIPGEEAHSSPMPPARLQLRGRWHWLR